MVSRTTIRDIEDALGKIEQERDRLHMRLNEIDKQADALRTSLAFFSEAIKESAENDVPAKTLRNAMVEILRETGHAMHYSSLAEALEGRGIQINGRDKAKNVGAHLSIDTRFHNVGKGMWALASWPASIAAPGNVEPDSTSSEPDDEPEWIRTQREEHEGAASQALSKSQTVAGSESDETFVSEEFDDVPF